MNTTFLRRSVLLFVFVVILKFAGIGASEIFQAPVPDGGEMLSTGKAGTATVRYGKASLEEIAEFYNRQFVDKTDIKWNEAKDSNKIVIYDWGNRKWHRINVFNKGTGEGTFLMIKKDSWTWIIGTLIIRFVGVFIVLFTLMITLLISGSIFSIKKRKLIIKRHEY